MPTTFLSLPRELRDAIYEHVLISPTHYMEPRLLRSIPRTKRTLRNATSPALTTTSLTTTSAQFVLCIDPFSNPRYTSDHKPSSHSRTRKLRTRKDNDDGNVQENKNHTSLSICRANRQIYLETQHMFYTQNTLYFSSFAPSSLNAGALTTLKLMGQAPSRLLQSITIKMSPLCPEYTTQLPKLLLGVASRARHGKLRKLTLQWDHADLRELATADFYSELNPEMITDMEARHIQWNEGLLNGLTAGRESGASYERVIEILTGKEPRRNREVSTVKALHVAFGGKLYIDGVLAWELFEEINKV